MAESLCSLCPRACAAPRDVLGGQGRCGMGWQPVVARAALHAWEEPCISGTRGSGTIFFSGCTLGCVFCQNSNISHDRFGRAIQVDELCRLFESLAAQGAHNINLVTGGHFLPALCEALRRKVVDLPIVYNTGSYERVEALRSLEGLVDIYLPDLKTLDPWSAERYLGAPDYPKVATTAIEEMARQTVDCRWDEQGLMTRGIIVRHLVMPGHVQDAMNVVTWVDEHLPKDVPMSLMGQYMPLGRASDFPEINRRITSREYARVCEHFQHLDRPGYVQQRTSADAAYIPPFDLTGVAES